jgi:NAD(P)-dependent dehydrogenase (short-subunit alcohol dehydrogenase family)
MAERFQGKHILVAGGTGGLGQAVALAFLNESAQVSVTYIAEAEFTALKNLAGPLAGSLHGYLVDVTNAVESVSLIQAVETESGRLNALVNTVGGYSGGTPLWETAPEVLDRMMALNVRSGFALARAAVPGMLRDGGAIVNVSSRSALDHAAGASAYAASKAAAVALMDCLAADLARTTVRVNTILPSIIDTEANRKAMPNADFKKWPKPEEIAKVILFLCTDDSVLIRGASIPLYGSS